MFRRRRLPRRLWQQPPADRDTPRTLHFDLALTADQLFPLGQARDESPRSAEFAFTANAAEVRTRRPDR